MTKEIMDNKQNIESMFISYSHKNNKHAEFFDKVIRARGINTIRDVRDVGFMDSLSDFMDRIGESDHVLIVLSKDYLQSYYCLYEVLELLRDKKYLNKVHPVVIEGANIFNEDGRLEYVQYWKDQYDKLYKKVSELSLDEITSATKQLKMIRTIRINIGEFLESLSERKLYTENDVTEIINKIGSPEIDSYPELAYALKLPKGQKQEAAFEEFLINNPDNSLALTLKADEEAEKGNLLVAEKYLQKAIDVSPNMWMAHDHIGNVYYRLTRFKDSEASYKKAIEINPNNAGSFNDLALTQKELGQYSDVLDNFKKAILLDPENPAWHRSIGTFLDVEMNEPEQAIRHYKNAIALDPEDYQSMNNLGTIYSAEGRKEEARSIFIEVKERNPLHINSIANLIDLYVNENNLEEASKLTLELIRMNPKDTSVPFSYLIPASKINGFDHLSKMVIDESLKHNPDDTEYIYLLGQYFEVEINDIDMANQYYEKAMVMKPDSDMLVDYSLFINEFFEEIPYLKIGRRVAVVGYLKRALILDNKNERAAVLLSQEIQNSPGRKYIDSLKNMQRDNI